MLILFILLFMLFLRHDPRALDVLEVVVIDLRLQLLVVEHVICRVAGHPIVGSWFGGAASGLFV
jgi:hypothetical protein